MSTDRRQALDSLLADIFREPPLISTNVEPSAAAFSEQPADESSAVVPHATHASPDEEKAVTQAQQAKALLAGLNHDTAIRLRWAMRDIKAKRTKLTPVSSNDLEALLDLGFVAIVDEKPVLTDAGFLALD